MSKIRFSYTLTKRYVALSRSGCPLTHDVLDNVYIDLQRQHQDICGSSFQLPQKGQVCLGVRLYQTKHDTLLRSAVTSGQWQADDLALEHGCLFSVNGLSARTPFESLWLPHDSVAIC